MTMNNIEALIDNLKKAKEELNKNTNMSYSGTPNEAPGRTDQMAMSEAEPHDDDSNHEAKEQKIASKIKDEAKDLLDMHKANGDMIKARDNGQWYLDTVNKDDSVKPFGVSVYNQTANIKRKQTRTGEERPEVGRNVGVRQYTTSGSSTQAAHASNEEKRQKAKTKASTRTLADMSPEEKAALEVKYGAKIKT